MRGCNGEIVRAQAPGMLGVCWGKEMEFGAEEMAYTGKSTGCSSRGFRFNSQHPQGISQLSRPPVPGALMPSSDIHRHHTFVAYRYICKQNSHMQKCKIQRTGIVS